MPYDIKPLSCDPKKLKGLSEKLIVSHWENNYGGAVKRLNAIATQLGSLDFATAPVFVINGLKREELIATNSMILHELYFDGLGGRHFWRRHRRGAETRLRERRSVAGRVRRHGEGAPGRIGLGPPALPPSRSAPRESMGGRSYARARRRSADPRARHVRALLSARLRRLRGAVCRRVHGQHQLGTRLAASPGSRAPRTGIRVSGMEGYPMTKHESTAVEQNTTRRRGVGLRALNPERASPGFTLFSPLIWGDGKVYLVDLHGNVVHTWNMRYPPGLSGYLTERGTLFYNGRTSEDSFLSRFPFKGGVVLEADWNGKVLWEVRHPDHHHHGILLRNGNVLLNCM